MKDYANYQPKKQARTESVWEVIATGLGFMQRLCWHTLLFY